MGQIDVAGTNAYVQIAACLGGSWPTQAWQTPDWSVRWEQRDTDISAPSLPQGRPLSRICCILCADSGSFSAKRRSDVLRFTFDTVAPTIFEANAREMVTWSGGIADVVHYADRALEPEKPDYAELGYIGHLEPIGLRIDARVYMNKYSDFIDERSCILDAETQSSPNYLGPACSFAEPAAQRLVRERGWPHPAAAQGPAAGGLTGDADSENATNTARCA